MHQSIALKGSIFRVLGPLLDGVLMRSGMRFTSSSRCGIQPKTADTEDMQEGVLFFRR